MQAVISNRNLRIFCTFSALAAVLALITSVAGIFVRDLYRDRPFAVAVWYADNWITLLIAGPVSALALIPAARGRLTAVLILLGTAYYLLYNYAFFVFGVALNPMFIFYVAVLSFSIFALIFGLASLDTAAIGRCFSPRIPARWISGFLALAALMVAWVWFMKWFLFVTAGEVPALDSSFPTEADYRVTAGIDLSLMVGPYLLGAVWLWRRRAWGYIIAVLCTIHGAVLMAVLAAGCFATDRAGMPGSLKNLVIWIPVGVGCLVSLAFLLLNLKAPQEFVLEGART